MRRFYVHVHVPKTAGTSFEKLIRRNFAKHYKQENWLLPTSGDRYRAVDIERLTMLHPTIRAYSSHRVSLDLPYESDAIHVMAVAWLRDPVERFVSHYFFERFGNMDYCPAAREVDLEAYVDGIMRGTLRSPVDTVVTKYRCSQLAFLTGETGSAALERVKSLVQRNRLLLLPTERFSDACVLLERLFPEDFRDCSYGERRNVSVRDQAVTPAAREKIADLTRGDVALRDFAVQSFDAALERAFATGDDLQRARRNHSTRCRLRRIPLASMSWIRSAVGRPHSKRRAIRRS
ncbi:MAG TPA: sulfotransferase family 2 domain-containing protein [Candidatus Acidoferrum sp.]|nr:sulfotransferase family 2 domain-containing protein [Candidatus Acidoferrum sp.]